MFTVAVDRDGKDKGTDYFDCVAWRKDAEHICKHFHKNSLLVVSGRIQFRDHEYNGVKFRKAELHVKEWYFGDNRMLDAGRGDVTSDSDQGSRVSGRN